MKNYQGKKNNQRKSYKGKSNKDRRSDRRRDDDREGRQSTEEYTPNGNTKNLGSLNDISWYRRYPNLLAAASMIPYPWRPGMIMPMGNVGASQLAQSERIPGVAAISWIPSFGQSVQQTDPASIACKELYAKVRSAYSGRLYADAPDFLIYLGALDSIFSYIGSVKRLYRILAAYTPNNYQFPFQLAAMYGLNFEQFTNLQVNRMQMYEVINELILMTRKFVCPAVMDLFNRHYWLNDNIYADAPSENSQQYAFVQEAFYVFTLLNTPDKVLAGGLKMVRPNATIESSTFTNAYSSVENIMTFGRYLIDSLASWEDAYTISGYLMRAYEGTAPFSVDALQYDEKLELAYVPEVLSQIENATFVPGWNSIDITNGNFDVSQDPKTNLVISTPQVKVTDTLWVDNNLNDLTMQINMHTPAPTAEQTVIATRLKIHLTPTGTEGVYTVDCGTEIPTGITLYGCDPDTTTGAVTRTGRVELPWNTVSTPSVTTLNNLLFIMLMRKFDWAPRTTILFLGTGGVISNILTSWEIENVTTIQPVDLLNLHRICIYSELNAFTE